VAITCLNDSGTLLLDLVIGTGWGGMTYWIVRAAVRRALAEQKLKPTLTPAQGTEPWNLEDQSGWLPASPR
jgi:hypothetical protein